MYKEDPEETENLIKTEIIQEPKKLIYARSDINISKTKLISDMSDIPNEYYSIVLDLLETFKKGAIGRKEITVLTNHEKFKGHIELRRDQVRIILRHIKDDIYVVLGVFAKKADKDMTMYGNIINRSNPKIETEKDILVQLELSKQTEDELEKIVKEKARKNSR